MPADALPGDLVPAITSAPDETGTSVYTLTLSCGCNVNNPSSGSPIFPSGAFLLVRTDLQYWTTDSTDRESLATLTTSHDAEVASINAAYDAGTITIEERNSEVAASDAAYTTAAATLNAAITAAEAIITTQTTTTPVNLSGWSFVETDSGGNFVGLWQATTTLPPDISDTGKHQVGRSDLFTAGTELTPAAGAIMVGYAGVDQNASGGLNSMTQYPGGYGEGSGPVLLNYGLSVGCAGFQFLNSYALAKEAAAWTGFTGSSFYSSCTASSNDSAFYSSYPAFSGALATATPYLGANWGFHCRNIVDQGILGGMYGVETNPVFGQPGDSLNGCNPYLAPADSLYRLTTQSDSSRRWEKVAPDGSTLYIQFDFSGAISDWPSYLLSLNPSWSGYSTSPPNIQEGADWVIIRPSSGNGAPNGIFQQFDPPNGISRDAPGDITLLLLGEDGSFSVQTFAPTGTDEGSGLTYYTYPLPDLWVLSYLSRSDIQPTAMGTSGQFPLLQTVRVLI